MMTEAEDHGVDPQHTDQTEATPKGRRRQFEEHGDKA